MEDYKDKKWKSEAHLYRQHLSSAFYDSEWKMKHIQNIATYENMPPKKIKDRMNYFHQYHDNEILQKDNPKSKLKQYSAFIALIEFSTTHRFLKEFKKGEHFGDNKLIIPEKFKELEKIVLDEIKQEAMIVPLMDDIIQLQEQIEEKTKECQRLDDIINNKNSVLDKRDLEYYNTGRISMHNEYKRRGVI